MVFLNYILEMKSAESKNLFDESVQLTEKWSKIMTFLAKNVFPLCGILSRAIPSYIFYFTTDLGSEAFQLPVLMR